MEAAGFAQKEASQSLYASHEFIGDSFIDACYQVDGGGGTFELEEWAC